MLPIYEVKEIVFSDRRYAREKGPRRVKRTNRRSRNRPLAWSVISVVLLAAAVVSWHERFGHHRHPDGVLHAVSKLSSLLAFPVEALQQIDIARMNLLCAEALPGSENLELERSLDTLDEMAARVRTETERHYHRFQRNPAEFENSEGFFRMIMLAVVLAEDFHVRYTPNKIGNATDARIEDGFFGDAHDVFVHGLTGPKRQGTCSSLPVLQVAIGRRLG